jgi:hypothetical protein
MGMVAGMLERLLGRCAGLVPSGRRGWVEAVRAEAGEVPATARVGWLAGGLWLVAREAKMIRRIGYGLGVAAVAVAAALAVRYLWDGAHAGRDAGWDKARIVLLVAVLAGLPWVARGRQVFGPVGPSIAVRAVRAGGAAAIIALVLDFARIEHFPEPTMGGVLNGTGAWNWVREAVALVLIGGCLAAVLTVPRRWPKAPPVLIAWCAAAAALILFFTLAPLQVLITVYAAGILAITSRRSPITPATLAISTSIGISGGLLIAALWNPLQPRGPAASTTTRPMDLLMVLIAVTVGGTVAAGALAARRAKGTKDPLAMKTRAQQYLVAGPLTAASAALMLPLLRAGHAVHLAATCPATSHFHCTAAPAVWIAFLVIGPVLGLAVGSTGSITAQTPSQPPHRPPPPDPPDEPRPDGTRSGGVFVKI